MNDAPVAALDVPVYARKSLYPEPFARQVEGRLRRKLGDHFGLKNFGINLTTLPPGAVSALRHHHSVQDEFVYILEGHAVVVLGDQEFELGSGDCIGFPAGGAEHQLLNRGAATVLYLEVGDRTPGDLCEYPHDDLAFGPVVNGVPTMLHKDGTPYP